MTEQKTLGQVAYDAYCEKSNWKSLATGADLPQYADTKPEIRDAWEASASAVSDAVVASMQTATVDPNESQTDEGQADGAGESQADEGQEQQAA